MLPRASRGTLVASPHGVPGRGAEIRVPCRVIVEIQSAGRDVGLPKVGHGIAARFKKQDDVFCIGDPISAEAAWRLGNFLLRQGRMPEAIEYF